MLINSGSGQLFNVNLVLPTLKMNIWDQKKDIVTISEKNPTWSTPNSDKNFFLSKNFEYPKSLGMKTIGRHYLFSLWQEQQKITINWYSTHRGSEYYISVNKYTN